MADQVVLDAIEGPREPEVDVVAKLERAIQIIEIGDIRLLASDGPAGGQPPDISLDEWREMYVCMTEVVRELIRRWDRTP